MFLVPKDIYEKLLNVIDERENHQLQKLNITANNDGAFPDLTPAPPNGLGGPGFGWPGPGGGNDGDGPPDDLGWPGPDWPGAGGGHDGNSTASRAENPSNAASRVESPEPPIAFNYSENRSGIDRPVSVNDHTSRALAPGPSVSAASTRRFKHICEICWAAFQNRKDYETHKRDHLRQMGNSIIHDHDYAGLTPTGIIRTDVDFNRSLTQTGPLQYTPETISNNAAGLNLPAVSISAPHPLQYTPENISSNTAGLNLPAVSISAPQQAMSNADVDDGSSGDGFSPTHEDLSCHLCSRQFSNVKLLKKHKYYCTKKSIKKKPSKMKKNRPASTVKSIAVKSSKKIADVQLLKNKSSDKNSNLSNITIPPFQCTFCPFTFSARKSLDRHLLNVHEIGRNARSVFPQGEKRDAEKADLNYPNPSKVLKIEPYRCSMCGLPFKNKFQLKAHIVNRHGHKLMNKDNLFPCRICNTFFSNEKRLTRHLLNIHECDKDYKSVNAQGVKRSKSHLKCHECNKKFVMLFDLEKHVKEHHGSEREYSSWI